MKQIFVLIFLFPLLLSAQDKKQPSMRWTAIGSAGVVVGQSGNNPVFQLTNGINYSRFFTGIGIGYDTYVFNSIPIFVDWRMRFGKNQAGYLYGQGGYNFPGNYKEAFELSKTSDKIDGGAYFDIGLGYRVPVGIHSRVSLSMGYSRKNMERTKIFVYPCITGDCPETNYDLNYNFGRLTAKLSWELGY